MPRKKPGMSNLIKYQKYSTLGERKKRNNYLLGKEIKIGIVSFFNIAYKCKIIHRGPILNLNNSAIKLLSKTIVKTAPIYLGVLAPLSFQYLKEWTFSAENHEL